MSAMGLGRQVLTFDIAPVAWERARVGRYGHFTAPKTRRYKNALATGMRAQWTREPLKRAIRASIMFYMGCPKRRPPKHSKSHTHPAVRPDWDNLAKSVCDAANGILWEDDGQLVDVRVMKLYSWADRRVGVVLEIEELG